MPDRREPGLVVDLTDAYRKAFELTGFPFVEGTHVPGSFEGPVDAT